MANPTQPYEDWRQLLRSDVGVDPVAVTRDYPRMIVYVASGNENNYVPVKSSATVVDIGKGNGGPSVRNDMKARKTGQAHIKTHESQQGGENIDARTVSERLDDRSENVRRTTSLIADLCGEGDVYGVKFDAAWQKAVKEKAVNTSDVSLLMLTALVESSMFIPSEAQENAGCEVGDRGEGALDRSSQGAPSSSSKILGSSTSKHEEHEEESLRSTQVRGYGSTSANAVTSVDGKRASPDVSRNPLSATAGKRSTKVSYTVHGKTAHLLLYLVQGTMFFPVQRLKHLVWLPWISHLQDVSWTVHIYARNNGESPNGSGGDAEICILHKQTTRHYVEESDLSTTPLFELDWECLITVEKENPAAMRDVSISIAAARVCTPQKILCWISSVWKQRREELEARLSNLFQISLEEVSQLKKKQVKRL